MVKKKSLLEALEEYVKKAEKTENIEQKLVYLGYVIDILYDMWMYLDDVVAYILFHGVVTSFSTLRELATRGIPIEEEINECITYLKEVTTLLKSPREEVLKNSKILKVIEEHAFPLEKAVMFKRSLTRYIRPTT